MFRPKRCVLTLAAEPTPPPPLCNSSPLVIGLLARASVLLQRRRDQSRGRTAALAVVFFLLFFFCADVFFVREGGERCLQDASDTTQTSAPGLGNVCRSDISEKNLPSRSVGAPPRQAAVSGSHASNYRLPPPLPPPPHHHHTTLALTNAVLRAVLLLFLPPRQSPPVPGMFHLSLDACRMQPILNHTSYFQCQCLCSRTMY